MKILFVSSEVVPYSKTGGLADVSGALPVAMAANGHDARVITPKYKSLQKDAADTAVQLPVKTGLIDKRAALFRGELSNERGNKVPVALIAQPDYFNRDELYSDKSGDYPDNYLRFAFFSYAVIEVCRKTKFKPHVIHCHDWQSALVAVYLRAALRADPFFSGVKIVFTIHNMGYQGLFGKETLGDVGLPGWLYDPKFMEFYGRVNFLKGALLFSDAITTVSAGYAREIQTEEYGMGLEGVLREQSGKLSGILNGVDYSEWNPAEDRFIAANYSRADMSGKKTCKSDLQAIFGLPPNPETPLLGMVSRLDKQKGFDLIEKALPELMSRNIQLAILGTGAKKYHDMLETAGKKYAGKLGVKLAYDNAIAHKIEAGSDMFFMPSRYEPCGLNQMYSLKYGAVPVVRATGGLDDTISEVPEGGNGFKFHNYASKDMLNCLDRALQMYGDAQAWAQIVANGMAQDFSWANSAKKYLDLFETLSGS